MPALLYLDLVNILTEIVVLPTSGWNSCLSSLRKVRKRYSKQMRCMQILSEKTKATPGRRGDSISPRITYYPTLNPLCVLSSPKYILLNMGSWGISHGI